MRIIAYSVSLGFDFAKERISQLLNNGYYAEALLTSVFTFEKIILRTLKQLLVSAGLRSKDAERLLKQIQGLKKQKEIWPCFEPYNNNLPEIIDNTHWQQINKAVEMRNNLVHGKRVYALKDCKEMAETILALLDQTVNEFKERYGYDGWSRISVSY